MEKAPVKVKTVEQMTVGELAGEVKKLREVVAKSASKRPTGKRAVFVIDRGWIFAGDATVVPGKVGAYNQGYIRLDNAVWLFKWSSVGFASVVSNPKQSGVDIRQSEPVEIPPGSIIFSIPVESNWGL
jgi:hypothetical protein